jgi:hypothetical protein
MEVQALLELLVALVLLEQVEVRGPQEQQEVLVRQERLGRRVLLVLLVHQEKMASWDYQDLQGVLVLLEQVVVLEVAVLQVVLV